MTLHPLLARQVKRAAARSSDGTVDLDALLAAVGDTYEQMDRDRRLNDRAMALLQDEIEGLADTWKSDAEEQIKEVMDFVGEAIVVIDERGIILTFNSAAEQLFDYPAEAVIGQDVGILMAEEDAVEHHAGMTRYLESGQGEIFRRPREGFARRRGGQQVPVELNVSEMLIRGPGRRFIGIIRDITERKRIEQDLRDSEMRFRDMARSASDWFWETDANNRITYISGRVREVLGVDATSLIGRDRFEAGLGGTDPGEQARHSRVLAARESFRSLLCQIRHPRRGLQLIRLSGRPVFDEHGALVGYRGTGIDVTREVAAEQRAEMAQSQFAQAIETVTDGFALFDAEDQLVICNSQFRSAFAPFEELILPGVSFVTINSTALSAGLYHLAGTEAAPWLDERLKVHGEANGSPVEHTLPDGRWVECRDFRTADGGTLVVQSDVTAAKTREIALARMRQHFERILQVAADGIIAYDRDGRVSFVNRAAADMLALKVADMLAAGDTHTLFHHSRQDGSAYPKTDCPIHRALEDHATLASGTETFWRPDGTSFPVEYSVSALKVDGVSSGAVLTFRDITLRRNYEAVLTDQQRRLEKLVEQRTATLQNEITEHKRTQTALAASQNRMRNIADNLFEGVLVIDPHGHVVDDNRSSRRMLTGTTGRRLAGRDVDDLMTIMINRVPTAFADSPLYRVTRDLATFRDDDAVIRRADGVLLQVAYACAPLTEGGRCLGVVLSFRDIEALKRAQIDAVQASRLASVGQLAAGIAHEINTPIQYIGDNLRFFVESYGHVKTVLAAYQRLAETTAPIESAAMAHADIQQARAEADLDYLMEEIPLALSQSLQGVQQVTEIVRSMKEFSHPGTTTKVATDINRALESTLTVSRNEWKHHARIELDLAPDLPLVTCLPGAINQVFLNLIINAADAITEGVNSAAGIIRLTSRQDGNWVDIRISDNGPGVPDALRDRIFDPFFTTKEVGKGTGQGLMICRDIVVEKHKGQLYLESHEGEGATFVIRLPINHDAGDDDAA